MRPPRSGLGVSSKANGSLGDGRSNSAHSPSGQSRLRCSSSTLLWQLAFCGAKHGGVNVLPCFAIMKQWWLSSIKSDLHAPLSCPCSDVSHGSPSLSISSLMLSIYLVTIIVLLIPSLVSVSRNSDVYAPQRIRTQ